MIKNVNSPEEIDQLFDVVETSKGAAILRMMENEIGTFDMILGIIVSLSDFNFVAFRVYTLI